MQTLDSPELPFEGGDLKFDNYKNVVTKSAYKSRVENISTPLDHTSEVKSLNLTS